VLAVLAWLAASGIAVLALVRVFSGHPPAPPGARTLTRRELETVRAAGLAIYPRGGAIEPSGEDAGVALHADRFVRAQAPQTQLLVRLLFFAIEHATLVFPAPGPRGRRRFSSLTAEQQIAYLDAWRTSASFARRLLFTSLRAILTMGYFADEKVLGALGLSAQTIEAPRIEADLLWPAIGTAATGTGALGSNSDGTAARS